MKALINGVRVRENAVKLPSWDPTFIWYAKGVAGLRKRAITDPLSWRYQAAIHGYSLQEDPLKTPGEPMPSLATRGRFWNQCQHGSWFFLPWHRAYLAFFEQIVLAEIVHQGGPAEWALPYWDYSDAINPSALLVRAEFRDAKLPDGTDNALAKADRGWDPAGAQHGATTGDFGLTAADVDLGALSFSPFTSPPGALGFGGPSTGFHHQSGAAGALERLPHNSVHGGIGGWMGSFNTAGLDPLFWTHHANIDRLWAVWRARDPAFLDPTDPAWLNAAGVTFELHDATGAVRSFTSGDVVNTTAPMLKYTYEDLSDPLSGAGLASSPGVPAVAPQAPPSVSLVGASQGPVALTNEIATAQVPIEPQAAAAGAALADDGAQRVYLNLENITGSDNGASYKVYVSAGRGAALDEGEYAGLLPLFGVAEATDADARHGGSGITHVMDITDIVARLRAAGAWNQDQVHVTFLPTRDRAGRPDLKVGRISLYAG